jgi:manganese/zinc/iron transport system permease protein
MLDIFADYTIRTVTLGAALLGAISGVLGCFAVLRRQGLLGDALAHAALPGICIAFLVTGSKATPIMLIGAALAGWLGALALLRIVRNSRISEDSALGIVLSTFFAFGILLLTFINRREDAAQAGLDKFLFGQAAALVESEVWTMALIGGGALLVVALLYKEFKLLTFDAAFAQASGFNVGRLHILLTSLIVVAVVIGLQTVGVVLMASLLIGPAVAARQWTNRLGTMIGLAALIGALSGATGALLSVTDEGLPTGPMVILTLTVATVLSLLFAPARGIMWDAIRRRRQASALHQGVN